MERLKQSWYHWLNYVLGIGQLGLVVLYLALLNFGDVHPEQIGLPLFAVIILSVGAVYGLLVFPFLAKNKKVFIWTILSFVIATVAMAYIIVADNDFRASLYFLWFGLLFASSMLGSLVVGIYTTLSIFFFVMIATQAFPTATDPGQAIFFTVINIAAALSGYLFWKRHYITTETNEHPSQELTQKLEAEKLKSEFLINAITDGVIVFDNQGKIQIINPAGAAMLGWTVEEASNLNYKSVFKIAPASSQLKSASEDNIAVHPFQAVIDTGKPISQPAANIKTKVDEKTLIVSLGVSPILSSGGQISGAIAIFRDVSEEKAREQERAEFISTASHEMRTPIASIEGFLALAMNPKVCKVDDKAKGFIQQAHDATKHLGKLFQDLLTSTKAEDGRIVSNPELVEMGEFLDKLISGLRFSAEKKGLGIEYLVNAKKGSVRPLYYVMVDPDRMEEVISNLFDNAVKYTDEGKISVGLTGDQKTVQIYVKDQGIGIPTEDIPHLFQKFYRVDSSKTRSSGGTGLGLFICKKIVELYNGKIWVDSRLNEGSTFYVNLERISASEAQNIKSGKTITPTKTSLEAN